ncbi:hypothetical protein EYF80_042325 [Liparis tanakae]|uniref:Uncharacterized protein n=1 Tax=Liparis tanakae TaxID=230148 RepID=A0A4Z2G1V2_9TELE|nr:hypothetical protein EYF80_042325 [Liparis tanakae]
MTKRSSVTVYSISFIPSLVLVFRQLIPEISAAPLTHFTNELTEMAWKGLALGTATPAGLYMKPAGTLYPRLPLLLWVKREREEVLEEHVEEGMWGRGNRQESRLLELQTVSSELKLT